MRCSVLDVGFGGTLGAFLTDAWRIEAVVLLLGVSDRALGLLGGHNRQLISGSRLRAG
jgi:hypothetical protein